jgi:hypothetical protein
MVSGINYKGVRTARSGPMGSGIVASGQDIAFGAFVTRSADGYIKAQVTNVPLNYLGVANDDARKHSVDGFYAAGEKVPIIVSGSAYVWLLGGDTVDTADFVRFPATLGAGTEGLGIVASESTPATKTAYTIGRVIDAADKGSADYDQTVSSISGSTVTFGSSSVKDYLDLAVGDYVVIDSNEAAEVNRIAVPDTSTVACTMVKTPLASHANAIKMYKLVQIEVEIA